MEKGSEVPEDHIGRKFKGRVVFLGNKVKHLYGKPAIFEELSSSPAALEAGKLTDLYGCLMMGEHESQKSSGGYATAGPSTEE